MREAAVLLASAIVTASLPVSATGETVHVRDDAEADVATAHASGRGQRIRVGRFEGPHSANAGQGARHGYLRFDLSTLPADAVLTRAAVRLFVPRVRRAGRLEVFLVNEPWDEEHLSPSALPALGGLAGSLDIQDGDQGHFVVVEVLPAVQGWLDDPASEHGLALVAAADGRLRVELDSKENVLTSHAPELEVALEGAAGPPGPEGLPGPPGPPGPDVTDRLALLEARVNELEALVGVSCAPGLTRCGQACVDTAIDPNNCGACGNVCASGLCAGGVCGPVPPGDPTFLMPFMGQPQPASIEEGTTAELPKVDAYALLDRSGSMSAEINAIKASLGQVVAEVKCPPGGSAGQPCIPDLWAGAGTVGYQGAGGQPYTNHVDIQPQPSFASVPTTEPGGCCQETLLLSLWSVATGQGSASSGCSVGQSFPPRPSCSGSPAGGEGVGYPCYRADALRIMMLATDEAPIDPSGGTYKCPLWSSVVRPSALASGLRVVGILGSGASQQTQADLRAMATDTGAIDSTGQPLVFDGSGANAPQAIKQALLALATAPQTFSAILVDDPGDALDVKAAFVARVETAPLGTPACAANLAQSDTDGDGFPDTYVGVPAGTPMCWRVVAKSNTQVPSAASAQSFRASLVIRAGTGDVSSQPLVFVVPGQ